MTKANKIEMEIDAIRDKLYEETKDLTPTEHTRRVNEKAQRLAVQYGFTIGTPTNTSKASKAI